jgi:hypothetical protein
MMEAVCTSELQSTSRKLHSAISQKAVIILPVRVYKNWNLKEITLFVMKYVFLLEARQKVGLDWVLLKPGLEYLLEFLFSIVNIDH